MEDSDVQPEAELSCIWMPVETQNPQESLDHKYWKKIFIASCLCALLVDPLFLYVPILKDDIKCLMLDQKLKITVLILRSITDFFYLMDIIIQIYRHENYSSGLIEEHNDSQNQMKCSFVWKSRMPRIAKTIWMSHDILIDIVAVLPFPQVAILIFFSKMSDLRSLTTRRMVIMNVFALLQYLPRVLRIYLSVTKFKRTLKEEITETPIWIKGVLNFSMYIIASHVFGAVWYFFAIQRMMICWHSSCRKDDGCDHRIFSCHDHHAFRNTTILDDLCRVTVNVSPSDIMPFDFGIFATVLQSGIVGSTNYFQKFLTCFWWGLRNLSSLGSNLVPSIDGWETLYTVLISIIGLLMFLYLIGNLQMYMQFETTRKEDHKHKTQMRQKMKQKDREIELWLFKNGIATRSNKAMKFQFMEKVQQALEEYMDTNLDNILPIIPSDVQSRIKDSMPLAKLKQAPMLQGMDEVVLKMICQKLEPVRYKGTNIIIQKGQPLENMLFIVDGNVLIEKGSNDYDDSERGAGELCGEELLRWPFSTSFPHTKPLATESVKATGVVEALALKACDLESIYNQSIARIEAPRHRRLMKEEMEQNIDWLLPRNEIPERLNKDIKRRIMETVEQQFQEDKVVYWDRLDFDWDNLVSLLPLDFQNEIKSYMSLTKLKKVRMLRGMDEVVLKRIYQQFEYVRYTEKNIDIIQKDKPLEKMLFIVDGLVLIEKRSYDSDDLQRGAGELCGEELLRWPFSTSFPHTKPLAAESVKTVGVVEALALKACDLESIYNQSDIAEIEAHRHRKMMKEEMEQNIDWWIHNNGIPERLKHVKSRIVEKVEQQFPEGKAVYWENIITFDLDNLVSILPVDFQNEIKSYTPLTRLKKVGMLRGMDEDVLKRIYQQFEYVRYTEKNIDIIQKDKPLEKMLFIVDGLVLIEKRSYDSDDLQRGAGELCGEELLRWPFSTSFPYTKPLATESVKTNGIVEALALKACDLESIYNQSSIARIEAHRHRKMMKEEMEQNIDWLIPINGIPERLNQDIKRRMMKMVEQQFQEDKVLYWDTLAFDWNNLISLLPLDFQNEIKSYMPLTRLKKIPAYQNMEESVLIEICRHLRPVKYFTGDIIEMAPIQMIFIVEGTTNHEGCVKGTGEFCGEELLVWPFSTSFPDRVPTAAESPMVLTAVLEVLVLTASDMKSVATEFRKHFIKNYDRLVHNLVNYVSLVGTTPGPSSSEAVVKLFTEEELKEATGNYSSYNYVNEGGYGTVYEGILHIRVAIKTCNSTTGDQYIQSKRLVHEAFVLSQIRHKNVVRLLGCCLETKWPLMVYDRTYYWTLYEQIHIYESKLSFESRMKIAAETAGALAYLHSRSVIHRDVKTANILIDNTSYIAKVSGFGASQLLHEDEDEMEDEVSTFPGTLGYLDPEYLKSNVVTEKSDVYSFGVVLVELLTCQEAVSSDGPERLLANVFVRSVQEGRLGEILDAQIFNDEFTFEMAKKVSELAVTCLRSGGEERPSMEEVAVELEGVAQTIIDSVEYDKSRKASIFLRGVMPSAVNDDNINISSASSTSE